MAWATKAGHAFADPSNPSAFGVCDYCGQLWNLDRLQWQLEWRGPRLMSTGFRVCPPCMDIPFIYNKPIILPPDPVSVRNPRLQQTNLGGQGWGMGGWGVGAYDLGQSSFQPTLPTVYAPPMTASIDE